MYPACAAPRQAGKEKSRRESHREDAHREKVSQNGVHVCERVNVSPRDRDRDTRERDGNNLLQELRQRYAADPRR